MMGQNESFVIRILIVDGNPNGIRIITRSNWNGYGAIVPRSMLGEARVNPELLSMLDMAGIYILRALAPDSTLPIVYIGESDRVLSRLIQHSHDPKREIEDWGDSFIFVSPELNKAHIRYVEARMIERAHAARQAHLVNDTKGYDVAKLTLEDKAVAEGFFNSMIQCLETIGVVYLTALPRRDHSEGEDVYQLRSIQAYGFYDGSAFWVKEGSQASQTATSGCPQRYKELRDQLITQGILRKQDGQYVFAEDYRFDSPSAAAAVVLGRAANGWKEWKNVATDKTLDELIRRESSAVETERSESEIGSASGTLLPSTDEAGDEL